MPNFQPAEALQEFLTERHYDNLDWDASPAVDELPVISAICEPVNGGSARVSDGKVTVKGDFTTVLPFREVSVIRQ